MTSNIASRLTPLQLQILQHALGADQYGCGGGHRNDYMVHACELDGLECQRMCDAGLMRNCGVVRWCDNETCFRVTDAGRAAMLNASPKPPKLSRAKRRYQTWLDRGLGECGVSFGEYVRREKEFTHQ